MSKQEVMGLLGSEIQDLNQAKHLQIPWRTESGERFDEILLYASSEDDKVADFTLYDKPQSLQSIEGFSVLTDSKNKKGSSFESCGVAILTTKGNIIFSTLFSNPNTFECKLIKQTKIGIEGYNYWWTAVEHVGANNSIIACGHDSMPRDRYCNRLYLIDQDGYTASECEIDVSYNGIRKN